jgi:hypothetical protein
LHALALEDLTNNELKQKVQKLNSKVPKKVWKQLLVDLAIKTDAAALDAESQDKKECKYKLKASVWAEVQIDEWSEYSEDDRSSLALLVQKYLLTGTKVQILTPEEQACLASANGQSQQSICFRCWSLTRGSRWRALAHKQGSAC